MGIVLISVCVLGVLAVPFLICMILYLGNEPEKNVEQRYEAIDVARYVINYANANDMIVSNYKLQNILYFIQLHFLLNNPLRPCFADDIEARSWGVVVPSVYKEFIRYGSLGIPTVKEYWDLSEGLWNLKRRKYKMNILPEDQSVINDVILKCDEYSGTDLLSIVRGQTPWQNAYYRNIKSSVVSVESMLEFIRRIRGD